MTETDAPPPGLGNSSDELLLQFLHGRDVPCPLCRYNLCDLNVPRCPECGHRITLAVSSVSLPFTWLLITAIALAAGAGLGVLMFAVALDKEGAPPFGPQPQDYLLFFCWLYFLCCIPASLMLVLFRRRFVRRPVAVQMGAAVVSSAAGGIAVFAGLYALGFFR